MAKLAPMSVSVGAPVPSFADQLPARVGAALEADANAVDGGGQRQGGGQRGRRTVRPEEPHSRCLQRRQRNPRDEGPAAEPAALPRQQAQPADRCSAAESTTAADVRPPAPHRGGQVCRGERRMRDGADRSDRQAFGCDCCAGRRRPVGDAVDPEMWLQGKVPARRVA